MILKNPECFLSFQPMTLTLSQMRSVWDCFPWNHSPFLQFPCHTTLVISWWAGFITLLWQYGKSWLVPPHHTHWVTPGRNGGLMLPDWTLRTSIRTVNPKYCRCKNKVLYYIHQKWSNQKNFLASSVQGFRGDGCMSTGPWREHTDSLLNINSLGTLPFLQAYGPS